MEEQMRAREMQMPSSTHDGHDERLAYHEQVNLQHERVNNTHAAVNGAHGVTLENFNVSNATECPHFSGEKQAKYGNSIADSIARHRRDSRSFRGLTSLFSPRAGPL